MRVHPSLLRTLSLALVLLVLSGQRMPAATTRQAVRQPEEAWVFGACGGAQGWRRAEHFQADGILTGFRVSGVWLDHGAQGWLACVPDSVSLAVRVWPDGEEDHPGTLARMATLRLAPAATGRWYGQAQLLEFHLALPDSGWPRAGWLEVAAMPASGCRLLWGAADGGDGLSRLDRGSGWEYASYDLALEVLDHRPAAPELRIELEEDGPWLQWKPVAGARRYQVWRAGPGQAFQPVGGAQTATRWQDPDSLADGVSSYRVTALIP